MVHVDVPVGRPGRQVEVLVVWQELEEADAVPHAGEDWSDLFGILKDVPLDRAPQGEFEKRDLLE